MATTKTEERVIPAVERIRQLGLLRHDWDSYGGDPPTSTAIGAAERVVETVAQTMANSSPQRAEPRVISARGDGGIIMEWDAPNAALEIHVEPSGRLGYLLDETTDGNSRYTERDEASWAEIEKLLAKVVNC
jgi:hypothetical protein